MPTSEFIRSAGTVEITAAAEGAEGPKRATFAILGYTGAVMQVAGYYTPVIVDLAGLKVARQEIPVLLDHDPARIVGQTDSVAIDAAGARMTGAVTGEDDDARKVLTHAKNGFRWQASIGASVVRREFLEGGKRAMVNGREVVGPLVIAREAELKEISFVAIGADGATAATVAAARVVQETGANPMGFDAWLQAKGFDPAVLSDTQKATLQAAYNAEQAPPPPPPAQKPEGKATSFDEVIAAQKAENARVAKITDIVAQAVTDRPVLLDELEAMGKAAIASKTSPVEFELAVLRATRAGAAPFGIVSRPNQLPAVKVIEAAVSLGGGLEDAGKHYDQATLNAAADRYPSGLGLRDLLMLAARENGYRGHASNDVRPLLEAAFRPDRSIRADGGFSTFALTGILSNVANKFLIQGFMAVENSWRAISKIRNVRDFKAVTSYSLTGGLVYEKVGPGGELKHGAVGETTYSNQAETYGRMFAITRTDIINDDLGALTEVPMRLGRGAALALNNVFWTAWLAGVGSFWTAGRNNLITGGTTVLQSSSLRTALQTFRKQTDPDGLPIAVTPRILLVPAELEITADELMTSTAVNTGGSSTADRVPNRNVWTSKFQTVMSTYLSNTSYTNNSATAWWLLADPMDIATIEIAFLNGRETPVVESADADFNTLGIQMRGYHDFGVALQEYRGSVRSAGA